MAGCLGRRCFRCTKKPTIQMDFSTSILRFFGSSRLFVPYFAVTAREMDFGIAMVPASTNLSLVSWSSLAALERKRNDRKVGVSPKIS